MDDSMTKLKEEQIKLQRDIREETSKETNEIYYGLSSKDRILLKAYLSFIPTHGINVKCKTVEQAAPFVRQALFPSQLSPAQLAKEEAPFDLSAYISGDDPRQQIPRIFENDKFDQARKMFLEAARFDERQQSGIIRSYQVGLNE